MARKPIEIPIGVDAGSFEKGVTSGIIEPLEDAKDALRDLAEDKGPKKLEDQMRDAQKQTEQLKDETRATADAIDRNFKSSYRQMKASAEDASDGANRSLHKVSDTAAEASGELKQNLGETFSSFRGDLEDLPQIAQDVFGGLAGSVGGILPAIGLAAGAAGIGLLINAFNEAGEESDEFKAKAAELAQAYIDAGGDAAPAIEDIAAAIKELASATEDGETSLKDLRKAADGSKSDFKELAQAYAGNVEGLDAMIAAGKEREKQLQDEATAYDESNRQGERHLGIITDELDAQQSYNAYLGEARQLADEAAAAERNWREAGGEELAIKAQLVGDVAAAYDGVRDAAITAATTEEGVFDVNRWAEYVENTKVQIEQYQSNLSQLKLSTEQWTNLMEMPDDARMSIVNSLVSGPEEAKGKIISALTDAGSAAGSSAQVSFEEGFTPKADVTVNTDTSESEAKVTALTQPREMTVKVKLDTSELDRWRPPTREVPVVLVVDSSPLSRAIDRQDGRTVTVNVEGRRVGAAWQ